VALSFSEGLSRGTAPDPTRYAIKGLEIKDARLMADGRTVALATAEVPERDISVMIDGVTDLSGNPLATDGPTAVKPAPRSSADGLVAHWRFGESASATYVLDSCGGTAPALVSGNPQRTEGEHGAALVFDGKTSVATENTTFGLTKSNAFTVAFWARFNGAIKGQLAQKGKYAMPFSISGYPNRGCIQAYARVGASIKKNLPGKVEAGRWYHLAITAAGDTVTMYLDGKAVVTEKTTVKVNCPNEPLWMGKGFDGRLSDLRIYSRALSAEEIAKLVGQ
jgi:hypothetical protein